MFSRTWLSYCTSHRAFNHQRRLRGKRRRRLSHRSGIRQLVPELLEDRRLLAAAPVINVGDAVPALEGDTGTTGFEFNVTLSETSSETVTVGISTSDGSATLADIDYLPVGAAFGEIGGRVVVEAEDFSARTPLNTCNWTNVPGEASGQPAQFSNFRGGSYMQ